MDNGCAFETIGKLFDVFNSLFTYDIEILVNGSLDRQAISPYRLLWFRTEVLGLPLRQAGDI